jgi:hypothetical protein
MAAELAKRGAVTTNRGDRDSHQLLADDRDHCGLMGPDGRDKVRQ